MAVKLKQNVIRGSVTIASTQAVAEVALSQITDITKTILLSTHVPFSGATSIMAEGMVRRRLYLNGGVPTIRFMRLGTTDSVTIYYEVAEFETGVTVQHFTVTADGFTDTGNNRTKNVTMSSVNTAETFPIISATPYTTGLLQHSRTCFCASIIDSTNVEIEFDDIIDLAGTDEIVDFQIVTVEGAVVQKFNSTITTANPHNETISTVDLTRAFVVPSWTYDSSSGSQNGSVHYTAYLSTATNLVIDATSPTGATKRFRTYVVEMPAGITTERKNAAISAGNSSASGNFAGSYDVNRTVIWSASQYGTGCQTNSTSTNDMRGFLTGVSAFTAPNNYTIAIGGSAVDISTELYPIQFPFGTGSGPSGGVAIGSPLMF